MHRFSLLKKENEEDIMYGKWSYFNEHFADFQEVWLDSKHIKKVLTVTTDNFWFYYLMCMTDTCL